MNQTPTYASADEANRQAWFALAVLFAINTMNFFDRQVLASVSKLIIDEWGISDTKMGLMGTAFTLIYALVGVPLGRLADRGARTKILFWGVSIWSLFTAAGGLTWNYASLFLARMGVGVGEASCSPAGNSLIGDLYPASKRARAISVFMLGLPIGIYEGFHLAGTLGFLMVTLVATGLMPELPQSLRVNELLDMFAIYCASSPVQTSGTHPDLNRYITHSAQSTLRKPHFTLTTGVAPGTSAPVRRDAA